MKKLTPEDFQKKDSNFELLAEVSHQKLREFVVDQISREKLIVRIYSGYQVLLMLLFSFFLTRSIIWAFKGSAQPILAVAAAIAFSFTLLVVIHELLHALAYLLSGARNISFGLILRKFIFYALANKQVIGQKAFFFVALLPFVVVKIVCMAGIILFFGSPVMYFFLSVMCLHSLFCAGDMAMLAFYRLNNDKEIYNFDDRTKGKTYFYARKKNSEYTLN